MTATLHLVSFAGPRLLARVIEPDDDVTAGRRSGESNSKCGSDDGRTSTYSAPSGQSVCQSAADPRDDASGCVMSGLTCATWVPPFHLNRSLNGARPRHVSQPWIPRKLASSAPITAMSGASSAAIASATTPWRLSTRSSVFAARQRSSGHEEARS